MCSICFKNPCDSRCPNALELKPIIKCTKCRNGIYGGDEYFDSCDGPICRECMNDMSLEEILELVGEKMIIAEVYNGIE